MLLRLMEGDEPAVKFAALRTAISKGCSDIVQLLLQYRVVQIKAASTNELVREAEFKGYDEISTMLWDIRVGDPEYYDN
ncbi:hypothetical protein HDU76_013024 [Blyttiomyces sp. JEL0837]|nr:hypothetical protein HDU76_013024 [Blyttiomyces sp. JEL0837]